MSSYPPALPPNAIDSHTPALGSHLRFSPIARARSLRRNATPLQFQFSWIDRDRNNPNPPVSYRSLYVSTREKIGDGLSFRLILLLSRVQLLRRYKPRNGIPVTYGFARDAHARADNDRRLDRGGGEDSLDRREVIGRRILVRVFSFFFFFVFVFLHRYARIRNDRYNEIMEIFRFVNRMSGYIRVLLLYRRVLT